MLSDSAVSTLHRGFVARHPAHFAGGTVLLVVVSWPIWLPEEAGAHGPPGGPATL